MAVSDEGYCQKDIYGSEIIYNSSFVANRVPFEFFHKVSMNSLNLMTKNW